MLHESHKMKCQILGVWAHFWGENPRLLLNSLKGQRSKLETLHETLLAKSLFYFSYKSPLYKQGNWGLENLCAKDTAKKWHSRYLNPKLPISCVMYSHAVSIPHPPPKKGRLKEWVSEAPKDEGQLSCAVRDQGKFKPPISQKMQEPRLQFLNLCLYPIRLRWQKYKNPY